MASPFHVFRRHQKGLLIVAGVILIFVFVLDDSLRMLMGGTRGGTSANSNRPAPNAVAVHWNGGRLTNSELEHLVFRRRVINAFQRQVHDTGAQAEQMIALTTGATPRQLSVQPVVGPDKLDEGVERDVVRVRIFADAARAAGMTVSDDEIRRYLKELGRDRVSPEQMQIIIRRTQSGYATVSAEYVFNALREELLAHYYWLSHAFATSAVMPEQQWQDWLHVNDRVAIEAAGLQTDSFLVDVKEPTNTELTEYYNKFKDFEPRPEQVGNVELPSPNPGFAIPRRIEVQYVRADFDKLLAKVKSEITDEEVQKYYDVNKDPYYIKAATDLLDKEKDAANKPAGDADAKPETGDTKAADAKSMEGGAAADKQPAQQGDKKEQPAQSPADKAAPKADGKAGNASTKGAGKSANAPRQNVFQLASFEQQSEGVASAAGAASAAPAQTNEAKTDQPSTALAQPGAQTSATPTTDKPAETPAKPVEFLPLDDELKDKIRGLLAQPKVNDRLDQLSAKLQNDLNKEFTKYFRAAIDAKELKQPPPTPPATLTDLSGLAAEHELEFRKTEPMSILDFRDDKVIGKLVDSERSNMLYGTLFSKDADLYKAIATTDVLNNRYVLVKTSDTPGRVPPLDEIHDAVVKAWRFDQASAAALRQAQEFAKKAQATNTPLSEFFANDPTVKVVRTDQFAWLTGGEVSAVGGQFRQQPYRLSEPDEIVAADNEFMKTVFDLDEGQVAAVLNHNHSTAYVIRVAEHQYTPEKLRELYLAEANMWLGQSAMNDGHSQIANAALAKSLLDNSGRTEDRSLAPREESSGE